MNGGSISNHANVAASGTIIATVNSLGKLDIPGGYNSFLGLSVAVTGSITERIIYETAMAGVTIDPVYSYDDFPAITLVVTSSKQKIRSQPCELAGLFCMSTGGGTITVYDNEANSGDVLYTGTPVANQSIPLEAVCYRGLSVAISGTVQVALEIR